MFSPEDGFSMLAIGSAPSLTNGAGAAAAGAEPEILAWTCLYHQPLAGVWAYRERICCPAGSEPGGTTASYSDAAQYGLFRAVATLGRFCANSALASIVPLPSIVPCQTWTSS